MATGIPLVIEMIISRNLDCPIAISEKLSHCLVHHFQTFLVGYLPLSNESVINHSSNIHQWWINIQLSWLFTISKHSSKPLLSKILTILMDLWFDNRENHGAKRIGDASVTRELRHLGRNTHRVFRPRRARRFCTVFWLGKTTRLGQVDSWGWSWGWWSWLITMVSG